MHATPAFTPALEAWADDVWVASAPHTMFGLELGARMTVVRLGDGALWVHSPIALAPALTDALGALGPVTHIVLPNHFHHVYAAPMARAFPNAKVFAPPGLARKRRDLTIAGDLAAATADAPAKASLESLAIAGTLLHETVFVHRASRTVISADLAENFVTSDDLLTRLYLKAGGIHGRVGFSRLLRPVFRDRSAAKRSIEALLVRDVDRLILAHGAPIDSGAKDALRQTYAFLGV